jgi:L-rhamnose-H+ transport protein
MTPSFATGSMVVVAAGFLQGIFAVPMKYARNWRYENVWLAFTFMALVVFPWMLTVATVPHLGSIYQTIPATTLTSIIAFGLCWGIGSTLTGLGLNMLGIGLGVAIILGLSAAAGSLIPLVILAPGTIHTRQGYLFLVGTFIMLLGIISGARAGYLREKSQNQCASSSGGQGRGNSFLAGLVVVIVAGLLSSTLNLCYAFGSKAIVTAQSIGASPTWAPNVVTALATSGGFVANLVYCGYLLRRNSTTRLFWLRETRMNWSYSAAMAVCWFGGQALYGLGMAHMGSLGAIVGWPLLMGTIIMASSLAGVITGEWRASTLKSRAYMVAGIALVATALIVLANGQTAAR